MTAELLENKEQYSKEELVVALASISNVLAKVAGGDMYAIVDTESQTVSTYKRHILFSDDLIKTQSYSEALFALNTVILMER